MGKIPYWYCCQCGGGPMTVAMNTDCSCCFQHQRCTNCRVEYMKGYGSSKLFPQPSYQDQRTRRRFDSSGSRDPHGPKHSMEQSVSKKPAQPSPQSPVVKGGEMSSLDLKSVDQTISTNRFEEAKRDLEDAGASDSQKKHEDVLRDRDLKSLKLDRVKPPDCQRSEDLPLKGKSTALHLGPGGQPCTTDETQSIGSESLDDTSCSSYTSFVPSVVSAWLESIRDFQGYSKIARACKGICGQELEDTDSHGSSRERTASSSEQDTGKSSRAHGKRKASDLGDIQEHSSSAKPKLSIQSSVLDDDNRKFACHFFKKDSVTYASCCNIKNRHIKDVTAHLRKVHLLDCPGCTGRSESDELQAAHISDSSCQAASGFTPVKELKVPRTHNEGPIKRWYFIWRKLFPNLEPPQCPFWQPNEPLASQFYNYTMESLLSEADSEEYVEPMVQRMRTLWANFLDSYPEFSNRQLATPEISSSSAYGGSSAINASPESHQTSMDRPLTTLATTPRGPEQEPFHAEATLSSLGAGPTSSTSGRRVVETELGDATRFSTFSELQEGSWSSHAATDTSPHPENAPEEQQPDDMGLPTPTLEVGPETNHQILIDDDRPTRSMTVPEGGLELAGLHSEDVDSNWVDVGDFNSWLDITPEFNAEFDSVFDFMEQYTYSSGHFEDLEDHSEVGDQGGN